MEKLAMTVEGECNIDRLPYQGGRIPEKPSLRY